MTVNGIVIPEPFPYRNEEVLDLSVISIKPEISVFDYDGVTPVSLDRYLLTDKLSFREDTLESIYVDFISYFLTMPNVARIEGNSIIHSRQSIRYPGVYGDYRNAIFLGYGQENYNSKYNSWLDLANEHLISKQGFIPNYNYFINRIEKTNLLYINFSNGLQHDILKLDIKNSFLLMSEDKINSIEEYKLAIINNKIHAYQNLVNDRYDFDCWIYIKPDKYKYLFLDSKKRVPDWLS